MECLAELLRSPPSSTTPWGDTQLECSVLWSVRVWEGSQDPALKLKHPLVKASLPPHTSSPVCVCSATLLIMSGSLHQELPSLRRTSPDLSLLFPGMSRSRPPPVTRIAAATWRKEDGELEDSLSLPTSSGSEEETQDPLRITHRKHSDIPAVSS